MKGTAVVIPASDRSFGLERLGDFVELTKPRIAVLVLVTVVVGGYMGGLGSPELLPLTGAVIGTALIAAGSSVFNHLREHRTDALMVRTANRPLPGGRISQREAAWFGVILSVLGTACLLLTVNGLATSIAVLSSVLYAGIYTPLKRHTALNTVVGAIPGALPPVIGWAAVRGEVSTEAWVLFLIVFLWQFPHFFAIAWLHRNDYEAAGLKMLPTSELGRRMTGIQVVSYTLALIAVSLVPAKIGMAGPLYFWGALAFGAHFFVYGLRFMIQPGDRRAKSLMMASLVYLPMLLSLMAVDLIR